MSSSERPASWGRAELLWLGAAMLVALALRLLHWHSLAPYPWFDFLGLDAKYYDEWAQRILRDGLQGDDPYFMGPLYPHLLALVYGLAGRSLDAIRWLQMLLSVGSVLLVHVLARLYGGPRLARIASAMAALYGPFIYYSVSILYPTLTICLSVSLIIALHEAARRRSIGFALGAGALMGTYALGRGNILLFAPLAFFWLVISWGRPLAPRFATWKTGLRGGIALTLGTLAVVSLATIHNVRTGDPTLLTTNGGLNFYIGNGPMASGGHETPVLFVEREGGRIERIVADLHKDVECRTEAERALGRPLSYTEVSSFWMGATTRYIRQNPGSFLGKLVMKASHFWSTYEIPQIEHFGYFRQFSLPLRGPALTFLIVGPLSILGMALGLREYRRWSLLYLFVVAYSTSIILFFVLARYRLPIVPALLPFAALSLLQIWEAFTRRNLARLGTYLVAVLGIGYLMQANFYGVDEAKGIAQIIYRHGIVEDSRGNWEAAIKHYEEALGIKAGYDRCHLNLGVDLARVGRREEAMEHFESAERLNPAYYRAPYNRGLLLEELERFDDAREAYARAVELEPRYLLGVTALADMEILKLDLAEARSLLEGVLTYDGRWQGESNPVARARALRLLRYLDERRKLEERGIGECFNESFEFRLAELARLRDRKEEALDRFRAYFEGGGMCVEAYRSLGQHLVEMNELPGAQDSLERAVARDPDFPGVHRALAQIAAIRSDGPAAERQLLREMVIDPDNETLHVELGLVYERIFQDPARAESSFRRFEEAGGDPEYMARRRRGPAGGRS